MHEFFMIKIMDVIGILYNYVWGDKLLKNVDWNLEKSNHMKMGIPFRDIQGHLKVKVGSSIGKYERVWEYTVSSLYLENLSFLGRIRVSRVMMFSILEPSLMTTITTTRRRCGNEKGARTSWASSYNPRYKSNVVDSTFKVQGRWHWFSKVMSTILFQRCPWNQCTWPS